MSSHERPGGLTALAVFNFIFGGLSALGLLALAALLAIASKMADANVSAEMKKAFDEAGGGTIILLALVIGGISTVLLIVSGLGYLKQKDFMGRKLGTAYAVLAIVSGVIQLVLTKQPMGIGTLIGFIYPVLTLLLLNTTFKEDFVNP